MPSPVTAQEIQGSLGKGDDPLSIIKNSLGSTNHAIQASVEAIAKGQTQVEIKEPVVTTPPIPAVPVVETPQLIEPPVIEAPPVPGIPTTEEAKPNIIEDIFGKKGTDQSWKGLRSQVTRAESKAAELETQVKTFEDKLQAYEKGEVTPPYVEELKAKNKELERYQALYDLENSSEYIESVKVPEKKVKDELAPVLDEFGIPLTEIEKLVDVTSEREINTYLGEHFDTLTGLKVREKIDQLKGLKLKDATVRANPREHLQALIQDSARAKEQHHIQRVGKIDNSAKNSWTKALTELQKSGAYPEITYRGDPEHDKYVRENLERSAKEYGIFINFLANSDLKELPQEIGEILATRFALSDASGITAASRAKIWEDHTQLLERVQKTNKYDNPPLGGGFSRGGNGGPAPSSNTGPSSPTAAADMILQKIGMGK